ncbi:protein transport protein Sec16A isoform X3 [Homalodisca vitripennis]|uniref:protein transport protein Sec16A isoform X3 n=1 Tax=Homalodisca vitripennis TaxID=197043 RepID=UPI001EEAB13D|nr:protein transport protein Sec16A isoform X3 [Homalodisca vitripennis]
MWSNPRPPSRTSSGDNYNSAANPYSRIATVPKPKPGRQSTDPWDWGWEENSAQQDEWGNGWNQAPIPVPNVIPNPPPSLYHQSKPENKARGTPDLIPEKVNNGSSRGGVVQFGQQHYNQTSNASDFFENINLVGQNHQSSPIYPPNEVRRLPQPNIPQNYHMYQQLPPQNAINRCPTPASYFHQPPPPHSEPVSYFQQPPPSLTPNLYQNSQYYQPELNNQLSAQKQSGNYFDHNQFTSQEHYNYYEQNAYLNNTPIQAPTSGEPAYNPTPNNVNTIEVENVEVAPPERAAAPVSQPEPSQEPETQKSQEVNQANNQGAVDETSIPDNQETVPDNEEHLQNLPHKLSQMKITSGNSLEMWNSSPGWENQEVAPRCELDRNQYLETGQLVDSNETEEVPPETDNNDEGEPLPPPGLHRLVTGQGTESISQRSVLGQPPSTPQNNSGFVRLVPGQLTPSASPEPSSLERLVPGQQNNEEIPLNSSHRLVPGHQSQDSQLLQRFSNHQEPQGEMQRLVPGQVENDPPIGVRMIPGQLSDDENNVNTNDMERMIPGGLSEHEISFPEEIPDDERMVPGGMSDDSRSQSLSMDDERRNSSERMIPGMTVPPVINPIQSETQPERLVTGAGIVDSTDNSLPGGQDLTRHMMGQRNGTVESAAQPPLGLHRLVLGQLNSEANTDSEHGTAKTTERVEESPGGNVPPGMHRLVVGQFREKEVDPENDKEKETVKSNDREDDSDSDYKSDRRRQRHRRDSYDDERKERDYSSEREYRGKRDDRREYRKKRDTSYNRSPEYGSDHEEYERKDYRDRRDRDRRDRPRDRERDRDRRRRSPDYTYDSYYRDDPRKLPPRERDRRYYEPYEDDPYYYRENRSRPSSRSGSEYRRHRDYPRQPYYPEQGGMGNYMHYYQIQQYYENMRRNDPQAYAMWYERYMAEKFGNASNDRASVHSGRSSANDNSHLQEKRRRIPMSTPISSPATLVKSRSFSHNWSFTSFPSRLDEEDKEGVKAEADDTASHRSTPPLYTSAHIRGNMNTLGQLVVVNPHDPFSYGEHQPTVTVCKVAGPNAADTPDTLEFLHNPGPFISGVTHKNTVLQYLKKQCSQYTHSSEKLLYDLIRLVIKLNGVVDMTDVADLLMESYRSSSNEEEDFPDTTPIVEGSPPLSPHQITSKFRQLLLEGNKTEALEWAMKNKDWGHALFLASKMDSRTHNNVMLRFANGLPNNDPLQTLYQLMSGREPQAATCAADKKWGDWRPHLAMMLSNRTANVELDRKAILTLGDSLGARGRLFASHFCYLTAQLEFSNYSDRHAKLVLLGASPDRPLSQFATCRAIMLTLCYEYAKQLSNKEWCIPTLRPYKFLLACRLWDHGNLQAALAYLEALAQDMVQLPGRDDKALAQLVVDMADKLKCADSTLSFSSDPSSDPDWLAKLKIHVEEANDPSYLARGLTHGISTSTVSELDTVNGVELVSQPTGQDTSHPAYQHNMPGFTTDQSTGGYVQNNYYNAPQNSYYNAPQVLNASEEVHQIPGYNAEQQHLPPENSSQEYWTPTTAGGWDQQSTPVQEQAMVEPTSLDSQPQISVKPGFGYFANSEENVKPQIEKPVGTHPSEKSENKDKTNRRTSKTQQSGSGWFGGIWDKLARRPNNQMKLPDDKNPSIVWDEKSKRWVNTDASEEEQSAQLKPPPKASELNGSAIPSAPTQAPTSTPASGPGMATSGLPPPSTTSTNIYKLQRGKGMRGNYVDVMGSNKKPVSTNTNLPQPFTTMPQAPVTNFFVPAPVLGNENAPVDFLSPSGPVSYEPTSNKSDDQPPPLSRSSSASSLSREVTYYMSRRQPNPRMGGFGKGNTMFYNPTK